MIDSGSVTVIDRLVHELTKLPGIGRKTAQRLVFHLLKRSPDETEALASALVALRERVRACANCFNFSEAAECPICTDPRRDRSRICVVEEPVNVAAIERAGSYRGLYHVLGGTLSPLAGVGPDDIHVRELVVRIRAANGERVGIEAPRGGASSEDSIGDQALADGPGDLDGAPDPGVTAAAVTPDFAAAPARIEEVILATNPTVEGEATAIHIASVLRPFGLRVTRIAQGLPVGGDLEYTDEVTLARAMSGRRDID